MRKVSILGKKLSPLLMMLAVVAIVGSVVAAVVVISNTWTWHTDAQYPFGVWEESIPGQDDMVKTNDYYMTKTLWSSSNIGSPVYGKWFIYNHYDRDQNVNLEFLIGNGEGISADEVIVEYSFDAWATDGSMTWTKANAVDKDPDVEDGHTLVWEVPIGVVNIGETKSVIVKAVYTTDGTYDWTAYIAAV